MSPVLPSYPIADALPELRRALAETGTAVLSAPPGSGKTTIVPLALLDEIWLAGKRIVMLEPRRVAARSVSARMAQLLGEKIGETVGYQIRFERRISARTRIEVVTEGLLARRLQADPELPGVGLVIFDEFHERSLDADLALALTLDARRHLNGALRVLLMSATLDTARVSALLDSAPIVEAGGRLFPIDIRHVPPRPGAPLDEALAQAVLRALSESSGDVLSFLPGAREIRGAQRRLESALTDIAIRPLYGELSSADQDLALTPDADGRRKVILATNIAQTSLTVEGVSTVVDGGYARVARFDLGAGANRLETLRVSRASADQRAGRAGRLGPGTAYRLWSRDQHGALPAHDSPDILSADLTRFALELANWGEPDCSRLAFLDPPPTANWNYARELLAALGAVDGQGRITAHGRELLRLPAPPRVAHMLLTARDQSLSVCAAWVAAALDERDTGSRDFAAAVQELMRGRGRDAAAQQRARRTVEQMLRLMNASESASASIADDAAIARCLSWAYPERLARRREGHREVRDVAYLCADGSELRLPESDPLAQAAWLAVADWDPGPPRRLRRAAPIAELRVRQDHAGRIGRHIAVHWESQQEAVLAEEQERFGAIVLSSRRLNEPGEAATTAMIEGIRSLGLQCLPWTSDARQWQARVLSLRLWQPENAWPDVSDAALLATLETWLAPHLGGITRRSHLARLDIDEILAQALDHRQRQSLNRLAPTHLGVPSGRRHALQYQPPGAPALEVKLQEMFGCLDTPTVCEGRIRVVLHLLSPAQRPIAVTSDLAGFWARGYLDVRKDLRGRYPRHPWPDDPASATATARAKPRGT